MGSSWGHYGVSCDTLGPLGAMSGGPCAQFAGLKQSKKPKQKLTHDFVDFVWVVATFNINLLISFGFFVDFKHASLANNGGFAGLGPENAGGTLIFGYDLRNLRVKKTRGAEGC